MNTTRRGFIAALSCIAGSIGLAKKSPENIKPKNYDISTVWSRPYIAICSNQVKAGQLVTMGKSGYVAPSKLSEVPLGIALNNADSRGIVKIHLT